MIKKYCNLKTLKSCMVFCQWILPPCHVTASIYMYVSICITLAFPDLSKIIDFEQQTNKQTTASQIREIIMLLSQK